MSLEELYGLFDEMWERDGYNNAEKEYANYGAGREMLAKFHARFLLERPVPILVEQELTANMGTWILRGIIDRVDLVEDSKLKILDYKTGKSLRPEDAITSRQLTLYQVLAERAYSLPVAALSLHHLTVDQEYVAPRRSDEQVYALVTEIEQVVDNIRRDVFPPNKGRHCFRCDYKGMCPAWK